MSLEDRLRNDLRELPLPSTLSPEPGLADTVLSRARRRRFGGLFGAVAATVGVTATVSAAVAFVVFGVPTTMPPSPPGAQHTGEVGAAEPGRTPRFPTPGGGPVTVHAYELDEATSYLLDVSAGEYRKVPFGVLLAPDGRTVAVEDSRGRLGVADRAALLRDGPDAVRWIDVPAGNGAAWSPDGTALLFTSISKGTGLVRFTAHRYQVATGKVTDTPIGVDILGSSVGWAADSRRYLALLATDRTGDTVEPDALQYVEPDGTLGPRIEAGTGAVYGATSYSPSGTLVVTDAADLMSTVPVESTVLDVRTGQPVASVPPRARPVGWYDDRKLAWLAPGGAARPVLEIADVSTGAIGERIDLAMVGPVVALQLGPSTGLPEEAASLGF